MLHSSVISEVLKKYPAPLHGATVALGNHGGFSGANLWRIETTGGEFCLRAWPAAGIGLSDLKLIHALMTRALDAGLTFVPRVLPTSAAATLVSHAGRLWDLTTWLPGDPDDAQPPAVEKVRAATAALAQLHVIWRGGPPRTAPCPGIARRIEVTDDWRRRLATGWRPPHDRGPLTALASRAFAVLEQRLNEAEGRLQAWRTRPMPLQSCVCDIWHRHVLFTGDRVTGIVDFGSVKEDHVAVDLARLLGSYVGDDLDLRAAGLEAYRRIAPLTDDELILLEDLDRTGALIAAANWLRWLYVEKRSYPDQDAVAGRLTRLVERMEAWRR
jgi:Ser/Thr protein kinase RdoA (MazF antagonist)